MLPIRQMPPADSGQGFVFLTGDSSLSFIVSAKRRRSAPGILNNKETKQPSWAGFVPWFLGGSLHSRRCRCLDCPIFRTCVPNKRTGKPVWTRRFCAPTNIFLENGVFSRFCRNAELFRSTTTFFWVKAIVFCFTTTVFFSRQTGFCSKAKVW